MLTHVRGRVLRGAFSSMLALAALAATGSPAGAQSTQRLPSAAEIDPAFALKPLPPGYVRNGNDFVYRGGAVIVTPAPPPSPDTVTAAGLPCPDPYVCLYRHSGWEGTRWIFRDHYWQNLRTYGASDEVSSWSNHENRQAVLGWDSIEQGKAPYLYLPAHSHASGMGGWNDEASSVLP